MAKKTVVYIGKFIPPRGNAVAQRVYANAKLLRDLGYNVILLGCSREITEMREMPDQHFKTYIMPYPSGTRAWIKYCTSIEEYLKVVDAEKVEKGSLVVTTNLQFIAQRRLRNALKKRGIAYAEDLTEWIRKSQEKSKVRIIKDISTFFRMKVESVKTGNLICISKYLYDHFKSKGCTVARIPGLIDYDEEKWAVAENYSPNKVRTLVYAGDAGSIGYKERLDKIVKEACLLYEEGKPLIVEMIGVERDDYVEQCPDIANHPAFDKVAVFYGRQTHEFCLEKIAKADASVLVREDTHEMRSGFPTKLSESIRLGTPPILTMIYGYETYVTPGIDCIALKDTSDEEVRRALIELYNMSEEALVKMHNDCKDSHTFDYKNFKEEMKNFVETVTG